MKKTGTGQAGRLLALLVAVGWVPLLPAAPLSPELLKKAAPLLDQYYYNPPALKDVPPGTLPLGARVEAAAPPAAPLPLRDEVLPTLSGPNFGYLRLRSLIPPKAKEGKEWAPFETDLAGWNRSIGGLVLDLRRCPASSGNAAEFLAAAHIASWFAPGGPGHVLFTLQSSRAPQQVFASATAPIFTRPLVVLIGPETGGAGATLAAVLRRETGAILLGRTADDSAALFQTVPLDAASVLRIATAAVQLPDGTALLGAPPTPDIALYIDDKDEREILAQIALGPASKGLVEAPPRHHMNEASLVHEENPEIADYLTSPSRSTAEEALPLQDTALLRAVDILKGLNLFPIAPQ